jgi:hypothetical protein
MSKENAFLVVLAVALLSMNFFLEPIALWIAKFFGRIDEKRAKRTRAGKPSSRPGPECAPPPIEEAQISKYR